MSESIKIFSPSTVANVSCGFDVLGFALEKPGDEMIIRTSNGSGASIGLVEGAEGLPTDPAKNVATVAVNAMLKALDSTQGFEIDIFKKVKPGSGIGSSAASSSGAVFAANELLGRPFTAKELVPFAMQGEKAASGTAHADNVAPALTGGFALVRSYAPLDIICIEAPEELYATIIHPQIEVKTAHAREILRRDIPLRNAVIQWGNVGGLVAGLLMKDYDLIGRSLQDVIIEPIRSVLIPGYSAFKSAAMDAGALGSGISGSGPSVFALSRGQETAEKVQESINKVCDSLGIPFASYVSRVNPNGVKILD